MLPHQPIQSRVFFLFFVWLLIVFCFGIRSDVEEVALASPPEVEAISCGCPVDITMSKTLNFSKTGIDRRKCDAFFQNLVVPIGDGGTDTAQVFEFDYLIDPDRPEGNPLCAINLRRDSDGVVVRCIYVKGDNDTWVGYSDNSDQGCPEDSQGDQACSAIQNRIDGFLNNRKPAIALQLKDECNCQSANVPAEMECADCPGNRCKVKIDSINPKSFGGEGTRHADGTCDISAEGEFEFECEGACKVRPKAGDRGSGSS